MNTSNPNMIQPKRYSRAKSNPKSKDEIKKKLGKKLIN